MTWLETLGTFGTHLTHAMTSPFSLINPAIPGITALTQTTEIFPENGNEFNATNALIGIGVIVAGYYVIKAISKRR